MAKSRKSAEKEAKKDSRDSSSAGSGKKGKTSKPADGRRAILILFLVTVGLSVLFWLQSNIVDLVRSFFGPSSWTIIK